MKCLERNKVSLYYRLWEGMEEIRDEYGNLTGANSPIYSDPVPMKANVSPAEGRAFAEALTVEMFGINTDYDKVLVTEDMDCPISETTVLYIDKSPYKDGEIDEGYDYIVTRVSKSLNNISIAIKKVNVS